jgi:hypothetical protein
MEGYITVNGSKESISTADPIERLNSSLFTPSNGNPGFTIVTDRKPEGIQVEIKKLEKVDGTGKMFHFTGTYDLHREITGMIGY